MFSIAARYSQNRFPNTLFGPQSPGAALARASSTLPERSISAWVRENSLSAWNAFSSSPESSQTPCPSGQASARNVFAASPPYQ